MDFTSLSWEDFLARIGAGHMEKYHDYLSIAVGLAPLIRPKQEIDPHVRELHSQVLGQIESAYSRDLTLTAHQSPCFSNPARPGMKWGGLVEAEVKGAKLLSIMMVINHYTTQQGIMLPSATQFRAVLPLETLEERTMGFLEALWPHVNGIELNSNDAEKTWIMKGAISLRRDGQEVATGIYALNKLGLGLTHPGFLSFGAPLGPEGYRE
jgi:hypothetical protein